MISFKAIQGNVQGAVTYHDKAFAADGPVKGTDNYYTNEKAGAQWEGNSAVLLGVAGQPVTREEFAKALNGEIANPITGEVQNLGLNAPGKGRRNGYDFTIAPPKSVSIAALVGGDTRIADAHLKANEAAMQWMEKHGSLVRVKLQGEITKKLTGNLLWATVLHQTNRENEPQLHSHNVVAALTYDKESDKWRSLTNDSLLKIRKTADQVYLNELGRELKSLGFELVYDAKGSFEIKGFTREQIEGFSTRRIDILEKTKQWGVDPSEADYQTRQNATLSTRSAKQDQPREILAAAWQERAKEIGIDFSLVAGLETKDLMNSDQGKGLQSEIKNPLVSKEDKEIDHREALRSVGWAIQHLSEREQSFARVELESVTLNFVRDRVSVPDITWAIDQHIKNGMLIEREGIELGILTTSSGLHAEKSLIERISQGKDAGNTVLSNMAEFKSALATFESRKTMQLGAAFKLTDEQINAAKNVLLHADSYQGIQGSAGTGKTAALEFVKEVAEHKGWNVLGMATSSTAAKELGHSSGINSMTVAGFLYDKENAAKLLAAELAILKTEINAIDARISKEPSSVEVHKLNVKNGDLNLGTHYYAFDNAKGEVYRSSNSITNQIGHWLKNTGESSVQQSSELLKNAQSLRESLVAKTMNRSGFVAESLGRKLISYERVITAEAIAARSTLILDQQGVKASLNREYQKKESQLENLKRFGNLEGKKTLLVMDEASLTGVHDTEKITRLASDMGARVVFQGDTKQLSSVAAGRAFGQAQQAGMNVSALEETRRFDRATQNTKKAIEMMGNRDYSGAIAILDRKEVSQADLAKTVATRYWENLQEVRSEGVERPRIDVVTLTNIDRKQINEQVHEILKEKGEIDNAGFKKEHLDDPKLTKAEQRYVSMLESKGVNALVFRKSYREIGVKNGEQISIVKFDSEKNRIYAKNTDGKEIVFNPMRQDFFSPRRIEDREYSKGDLIEARDNIQFDNKSDRITNGTQGVLADVNEKGATVAWNDNGKTRSTTLSNEQLRSIDLAYARTDFKEQGATTDREIIAISETGAKIVNQQSAYVMATRAKDNSELVTSDFEGLQKNAGRSVEKSTAMDVGNLTAFTLKEIDFSVALQKEAPERIQKKEEHLQFGKA
jgi:conjugative relaxase-like TrwC/TraI family protein